MSVPPIAMLTLPTPLLARLAVPLQASEANMSKLARLTVPMPTLVRLICRN